MTHTSILVTFVLLLSLNVSVLVMVVLSCMKKFDTIYGHTFIAIWKISLLDHIKSLSPNTNCLHQSEITGIPKNIYYMFKLPINKYKKNECALESRVHQWNRGIQVIEPEVKNALIQWFFCTPFDWFFFPFLSLFPPLLSSFLPRVIPMSTPSPQKFKFVKTK